jgi:dsDNA-specific endonuclease/ATPase MutS2
VEDEPAADPIVVPIEETLDLHPFRPDEVRDVAREYLQQAREHGFREVRLIHGRGRGVQRANVQAMLAGLDFVETYYDASSLGATVVVLKLLNQEDQCPPFSKN